MAKMGVGKRGAAVLLSVALAGVAAAALTSYVKGVEAKAIQSSSPVAAYVAKDQIPAGKSGEAAWSEGLIHRVPIPRKVLAEGAIVNLDEIKDKVAAASIFKGEQIVRGRFVGKTRARGTLRIPADRQAVSAEVGIPPGVAGFVQAGDRVSIIALVDVPGAGGQEARAQYLLQDVEVLAVGQRSVTTETKEAGGTIQRESGRILLTLALTPPEAEKLAFAALQGQLYFTLLPPGQAPVQTPGRTRGGLFS